VLFEELLILTVTPCIGVHCRGGRGRGREGKGRGREGEKRGRGGMGRGLIRASIQSPYFFADPRP